MDPEIPQEDLVEAVRGTRALVGVIADSLIPALGEVTMPQFRALVLLRALGPMPAGALAARLGVTASTGTRLVARLVRGGWVHRSAEPSDRRLITLDLTATGTRLVDETRRRRERALVAILGRMEPADRAAAIDGLRRLGDAAGEPSPESLDLLAMDAAPQG
ncbi:MAG TPA: MarR family transcriptional regulator [Amnibacterium sp.]|nr:MarR family transcriptional regulator [Amnibacterium sp.]